MLAQFGWRHLFAACGVATAVAAIALSVSGLPLVFGFVQAGPTSHRLTNPRHEPAAKAVPFLPRSFLGGISIPYEPAAKAVASPG